MTASLYDKLSLHEDDDDGYQASYLSPKQSRVQLRKPRPVVPVDFSGSFADVEEAHASGIEAHFKLGRKKVLARLTSSGITLNPTGSKCCRRGQLPQSVPFSDILSATLLEKLPLRERLERWIRRKRGGLALGLHTFTKHRRKPAQWHYSCLLLISEDPAIARGWVHEINSAVRAVAAARPSRLLVLVNPHGGARKAPIVWARKAQPILHLAGVECVTTETEYAEHAYELVANLSLQDLEGYDGILAVGGDGLFQEVMNGVLALRREGGPRAAVAENLRLGQIPAGSTDAVTWSINGTRSVEAAALHVALGDGSALDVMRVDSADGRIRHSVCYAAYGYMGDLMRQSERIRWLGPLRYALSGAIVLLRGRSYKMHISYAPAVAVGRGSEGGVCTSACEVCASGVVIAHSHSDFASPSSKGLKGVEVREIEGDFKSVMAMVTPCRSDLSPVGLSPHSHLADGRIRLVLVRKCSRLQYLRFLASIPKTGVRDGQFSFVEVVDVSALRVKPIGRQSSWNVDGELLKNNTIDARIHRGLIRIFSRGIPS